MHWMALLFAVVANAVSNIAFKKGVTELPTDQGALGFLKLFLEPWIWVGGVMAVVLLGCYLYALRGIDLSIAYPAVTGLAMLGIALGGMLFLDEAMSLSKGIAMALIVAGVVLLKQTS